MSPGFPSDNLEVITGRDSLKYYIHGDQEIKFCFCGNCGIYTFYEPSEKASHSQCKVNLGCFDEIDIDSLEIVFFDGKNLL
jgi:hypothetical protein